MKKLTGILLFSVFSFWSQVAQAQCNTGCTYTITNSNKGNYFTLTAGQKLCIPSGQTFTGGVGGTGTIEVCGTYSGAGYLNSGITVVVNTAGKVSLNSTFQVEGSLTNNGNATNAIDVRGLSGTGNITNSGKITIGNDGLDKSGGTISNTGLIKLSKGWKTSGTAAINNSGTIQMTGSSQEMKHTGGNFANSGLIDFTGNNTNLYVGGSSGTFNNSGQIKSPGTNNDFTLEKNGTNSGTIDIKRNVLVNTGYTLNNNNNGSVVAGGALTVNGTLNNNLGGSFTANSLSNTGTLLNTGTLGIINNSVSSGSMTNNGSLNIGGSHNNNGGRLYVMQNMEVGGNLTNSGGQITFAPNTALVSNSFNNNSGGSLSCPSCSGGSLSCSGVATNTNTHPSVSNNPVYTCQVNQPGCGCNVVQNGGLVVLPVTLVSFSWRRHDEQVLLTWATASERNNAGFDIELSFDGRQYETLAHVEGQGNSQRQVNYSYAIEAAAMRGQAQVLVRLKQIDFNGKYEYSPVLSINQSKPATALVQPVNPSPAGQPLKLHWVTSTDAVTWVLTNSLGHQVTGSGTMAEAEAALDQQMQLWGKGLFMLQLQAGDKQELHRLMRQ